MRLFEIILKVVFLGASAYTMLTQNMGIAFSLVFLNICLFLGIILIVNKDASYHYPQTKKDYFMRRIEGVLLIIFAIALFFSQFVM